MNDYESPAKRKLSDGLAKMGRVASPELKKFVKDAIANIDDTDPTSVRDKLPQNVLRFFQECALRGLELAMGLIRSRRRFG